jgi:hypothetical protein
MSLSGRGLQVGENGVYRIGGMSRQSMARRMASHPTSQDVTWTTNEAVACVLAREHVDKTAGPSTYLVEPGAFSLELSDELFILAAEGQLLGQLFLKHLLLLLNLDVVKVLLDQTLREYGMWAGSVRSVVETNVVAQLAQR